jgi:2'-5' RNA ligase
MAELRPYSIFFLLRGQVGARHDAFRRSLAEKFHIHSAIKRESAPHVTLKYDMEMDAVQLSQMEHALEMFCTKQERAKVRIAGVAHFDKETIYAKVHPSHKMQLIHQHLHEMLASFPWVTFRPYEKTPHLHATLAFRDLTLEAFPNIWEFCQTYDVQEEFWFDNLALCPLIDGKRRIYRVFEFTDSAHYDE